MSSADLIQLLLTFKYGALFVLVIVEGFFSTIAAGSLAANNLMNLFVAFPVVIAGDLFGDFLYYTFGAKLAKTRFAHYLGLSQARIIEVEALYRRRGPSILILAKLSSYLAVPVIVAAGAIRMRKRRFYSYCFVAAAIKAATLLAIGYYFGKSLDDVVQMVITVSIGLTVAVLMYWYGSHALRRHVARRQARG